MNYVVNNYFSYHCEHNAAQFDTYALMMIDDSDDAVDDVIVNDDAITAIVYVVCRNSCRNCLLKLILQ